MITDPFPVSELLLCSFASYLADEGLAPQTVKTYLASVRNTQLSLGLPDPREGSSLPILKWAQAGISRLRLLKGTKSRVRLPITIHILRAVQAHLHTASFPDREVFWAIAATAFFGFFRLGELIQPRNTHWDPNLHLSWGDFAVDNHDKPQMVQIHLRQSKCDQFGRGADVIVGRTDDKICPVDAILAYLKHRNNHPGPFFVLRDATSASKEWFIQRLRESLEAIGLPQSSYAGHSFRIGAATTAALAGLEDSIIQKMGRWNSSAYLTYIRTPKDQLASVAKALTKPQRTG
ncbi:uncharacterized protein LOC135348148 [Halichondria panicea]|uniref:uncharacterized protein LOC135348148 n=1 Tax=Halichondria panicea TaxID=6063 RepID=UPI00312B40AE